MLDKFNEWSDLCQIKYHKQIHIAGEWLEFAVKFTLSLVVSLVWLGMSYLLIMALYRVAFGGC